MRRNLMRSICLALCLALCLGGTALAAEGRVAMGRYVETPIDLPMGGALAFAGAGGRIYGVDGSGEKLIAGTDLNALEQLETGHDENASPAQGGVNWIGAGEGGALYLASGWAMVNEEHHPYIELIADGQSTRVQLDQRLDTGSDRLVMCVLPSGELLGLSETEAYRFSAEGKTLQRYAVSGGTSMAAHANEMAVYSARDNLITVLDIDSGLVLRTLPLPGAAAYAVVGYDAKGALYSICPDGLYQVNAGGTLITKIADGRLMTASRPDVEARALLFDQEDNPVVAYWQEGNMLLMRYRYDEDAATEPGTVLSVFTLYDSATLRACADQFQKQHPDVMVDIDVVLPEGTAVTRDDVIRTLNTQLLAGKGPDIMVLDGLPVLSYLDKGVLMDLSGVAEPMIESGALLGNVAGAFKAGDAISAVPTRFLLPSLWGDVRAMNTLEDMADWARANTDVPAAYTDVDALIGTFYVSCAPAWFAKDGWLDQAKIEAFLTALKAIRAPSALLPGSEPEGAAFAWDWNPYRPALGYNSLEESRGVVNMRDGIQKQLPYLLRGLDSARHPNSALVSQAEGGFAPLPGQAEGCFVPMLVLGLNKSSAHGEAGLRFVEYMLSEEGQTADLFEGLPVNAKALAAQQAREEETPGLADWKALGKAQQEQLRGMIERLTTPVIPDFTLYQMIVSESAPFFAGEIDAEQAAQNLCAKANAYLSQ